MTSRLRRCLVAATVLGLSLSATPAVADVDTGLSVSRAGGVRLPSSVAVDERHGRVLRTGFDGVRVTDLAGRGGQLLPGVVGATVVELSPDGRTFALATPTEAQLVLLDAATLAITRFATPGGACPGDVAWVGRIVHALDACGREGFEIVTVDADTGSVTTPTTDLATSRTFPTRTERNGIEAGPPGSGLVVTSGTNSDGGLLVWDTSSDYRLVARLDRPGVDRDAFALAQDGRSVVLAGVPSRRYRLPDLAPLADLPAADVAVTRGSSTILADEDETNATFDGAVTGSGDAAVLRLLQGDRVVREVRAGATVAVDIGASGATYALLAPRETPTRAHLTVLDGAPGVASRLLVEQPGGGRTPLAEPVGIAVRLVDLTGAGLADRSVDVTRTGPDGAVTMRLRTGDRGVAQLDDAPLLLGHYDYEFRFAGEPGRAATTANVTHEVQQRAALFRFSSGGTEPYGQSRGEDAVVDRLGRLWVSQPGRDRVLVLQDGQVPVGIVPAVPGAWGLALSADGSRVLVTARTSSELVQVDVLTLQVVDRRDVRPAYRPVSVTTDGTRTYLGFCGDSSAPDQVVRGGGGSIAWLDTRTPAPGQGATTEQRTGVTVWRTPPESGLACYDVSAEAGREGRLVFGEQRVHPATAHVVDVPVNGGDPVVVSSVPSNDTVQLLDAGRTVLTGSDEVAVASGARVLRYPHNANPSASAAGLVAFSDPPREPVVAYRRERGAPVRSAPSDGALDPFVNAVAVAPDGSAAYAVSLEGVARLDLRPALLELLTAIAPDRVRSGEPVVLTGRLSEQASGRPLSSAPLQVVRVAGDGTRSQLTETVTAPDGTWRLSDLPPADGVFRYEVRHVGERAWSKAAAQTAVGEPRPAPSGSPTAEPSPTASPTASPTPSPSPSASPSPGPTLAPTATPTAAPSPRPSPSPSARSTEDACPPDRTPEDGFADVPDSDVHESSVDCVVWWGVARGRAPGEYAPAAAVTRAQMATFITNLVLSSGGSLAEPRRDHFADDNGSPHERSINLLAEAGVVAGRSDGGYGPGLEVTRAQMAKFLVLAYELRSGQTLSTDSDYFSDDDGTTHEASINRAAAAGFTGGTGQGYSPGLPVRRSAMASFLARVLDRLVEDDVTRPPAN